MQLPPRKKEEVKEKPILGRFSSNLKVGIVGLPNVGKSTLFNTLTKMGIPAENFPFCTIDPNSARVNIPDERYEWLCQAFNPKSGIPAFLEIVDIAGLVKGAAKGEGLGNAFLSNISAVDGIFHVCRAFDDPDVVHVEDRVDPVADLEIIGSELRAKDVERLKGVLDGLLKLRPRGLVKEQKDDLAAVANVLSWVLGGNVKPDGTLEASVVGDEAVAAASKGIKDASDRDSQLSASAACDRLDFTIGRDVRNGDWSAREIEFLNSAGLITAKPVVYLCNLSERDYARKKNKWLPKIFEWIQKNGGGQLIPFSGALEAKLFDMPDDEKAAYCEANSVQSALHKIIVSGFRAVHLIYFFTCGPTEVRCWQIRQGAKAPQAAGAIHTDFERGFICAEVMHYDELREAGSEAAVKAAGKYRQEGKNYVVQDGDICHFKFNVTAEKKK